MIEQIKHQLRENDRGYTPLEVLGTLFLIGILVTFLLVRFLGWRDSANDRKAQATARSVVLSAEGFYQENLVYSDTAADFDAEVQSVIADAAVTVTEGASDQILYVNVLSDSGTHMAIILDATAATQFCTHTAAVTDAVTAGAATCSTDSF